MANILSPEFWESEWAKFRKENSYTIYNKHEQAQCWNERADQFSARSKNRRTQQILDFLNSHAVLTPGINVLDIGCGSGLFAIPMCRMGMNVKALDPSERMLNILTKNLPLELTPRLDIIKAIWEDYDVVETCWENAFDLVFASMTPGINDLSTIKKMIYCSSKWCYFSGFSGVKKYDLFNYIWNDILGKDYYEHFNDIIFPFNIIYSLGYKPELTFIKSQSSNQESLEYLEKKLLSDISHEIDLTPSICSRVHELLLSKSTNGMIEHNISSTSGQILWRTDI